MCASGSYCKIRQVPGRDPPRLGVTSATKMIALWITGAATITLSVWLSARMNLYLGLATGGSQ